MAQVARAAAIEMNKHRWLAWAEVFDSWRVVPRLFLAATLWWAIDITYRLVSWYTKLPSAERGFEASGFAAVALASVLAFLKLVFTEYSKNGRDWNEAPAPPESAEVITATSP